MNAALWGLMAAIAFGAADFCGRYTSRALGPASALLGLMLVGAVLTSLRGLVSGADLVLDGWLVSAGLAAMLAPLAFYRAMTLASLSLVMPITASYPALVVPYGLLMGIVPEPQQWLGMGLTGLGALIVARTAADEDCGSSPQRRPAILWSCLACALFAAALILGGEAVARHGAEATLWVGRLLGGLCLLAGFLILGRRPVLPRRWWGVLAVQGVLDGAAYYAFYLGAADQDAAIAAVASSAFMVVGVLLGWLVLKERVGRACWAGVGLVFAGIALLSVG